jgi:hypothetical protein
VHETHQREGGLLFEGAFEEVVFVSQPAGECTHQIGAHTFTVCPPPHAHCLQSFTAQLCGRPAVCTLMQDRTRTPLTAALGVSQRCRRAHCHGSTWRALLGTLFGTLFRTPFLALWRTIFRPLFLVLLRIALFRARFPAFSLLVLRALFLFYVLAPTLFHTLGLSALSLAALFLALRTLSLFFLFTPRALFLALLRALCKHSTVAGEATGVRTLTGKRRRITQEVHALMPVRLIVSDLCA